MFRAKKQKEKKKKKKKKGGEKQQHKLLRITEQSMEREKSKEVIL